MDEDTFFTNITSSRISAAPPLPLTDLPHSQTPYVHCYNQHNSASTLEIHSIFRYSARFALSNFSLGFTRFVNAWLMWPWWHDSRRENWQAQGYGPCRKFLIFLVLDSSVQLNFQGWHLTVRFDSIQRAPIRVSMHLDATKTMRLYVVYWRRSVQCSVEVPVSPDWIGTQILGNKSCNSIYNLLRPFWVGWKLCYRLLNSCSFPSTPGGNTRDGFSCWLCCQNITILQFYESQNASIR